MEPKNKAIVGLVIATLVLSGIAVAVSADVGPMDIMPGAIRNYHLKTSDSYTMAGLTDTGTLTVTGAMVDFSGVTTSVKLPSASKIFPYITVHNESGNFSFGADWTPILNTSSTDFVDESEGETVKPIVNSEIIVTYSGNVTSAAGDVYVKCGIGDGTGAYSYATRSTNVKVGSNEQYGVTFTVPFFYETLTTEKTYNVTIFAQSPAGTSYISNQTLVAITMPA